MSDDYLDSGRGAPRLLGTNRYAWRIGTTRQPHAIATIDRLLAERIPYIAQGGRRQGMNTDVVKAARRKRVKVAPAPRIAVQEPAERWVKPDDPRGHIATFIHDADLIVGEATGLIHVGVYGPAEALILCRSYRVGHREWRSVDRGVPVSPGMLCPFCLREWRRVTGDPSVTAFHGVDVVDLHDFAWLLRTSTGAAVRAYAARVDEIWVS